MKKKMKMQIKLISVIVVSMAAAFMLSATPAYADKIPVSDAALDAIYGAANNVDINGPSTTTIGGLNLNGNIQVGSFQWDDNHQNDSSINKGANIQSGETSMVQQNANVLANALAWGAVSQSITINSGDGNTIGGSQTTEAWAVLFIGGF
jgi:hypothetical protein